MDGESTVLGIAEFRLCDELMGIHKRNLFRSYKELLVNVLSDTLNSEQIRLKGVFG